MIRNEVSSECLITLSRYFSQLSSGTRTKISQAAHRNIHPYQQRSNSTFDSRYGSTVIVSTHLQALNTTQNIHHSKSAWTWHKSTIQICTLCLVKEGTEIDMTADTHSKADFSSTLSQK